ncbi:MAG: NAD-dependent epimerase/dehydratase family protein [Nitrospirales bacterium]|nr:NAD-dependent epimerase/dehydratase family protein [Nitrospira sp.]MDR4503045.1 NAD-dependent epimerase/dehydratase family protein [Nitrospirales bacterium]
MMKAFVTGGTGFTGSHLCAELVRQGYQVRALVRENSQVSELEKLKIEQVQGDLCDPSSFGKALEGVDIVFHIAALFRQQGVNPEVFRKVNGESVGHLIRASLDHGVKRFIHCSTVGVHGHIEHSPANEDAPFGPGDLYQETKLEGELIARQYQKEGKLDITIVRPAGIYGPGDLRFLKLFKAIHRRRFVMIGKGTINYHFTYIDDLIQGIMLSSQSEQAIGQTYIIAGKEYVPLNQLVTMIAEALHVKPPSLRIPPWPVYAAGYVCELLCKPLNIEPPLYRRRIDFFKKNRAFDITKASKELGFEPQVNLKEGIHRTACWYKEHGYL